MNFQTGKHKKNSSLLIFTHTSNAIGHVIIPKTYCSSREGINSHCRCFDWFIFAVFGQSVRLSITTVVAAPPTGRWPFKHDHIVTGAAGLFNSQMSEGRLS